MNIEARRRAISSLNLKEAQHAGLVLHRYLSKHDDTHEGAKDLYTQAQNSAASPVYAYAFARWKEHLQKLGNTRLFAATASSPIAVGLGNESVLEVGLTVHHTYGMPIIPGSALKGLCRRGAARLQDEGKITREQFEVLFGYSNGDGDASAGYITFWDAWYDPESVEGKPFHRDVITVHHPDYYSSRGANAFPTDFDDPNPVPFLVVKPGARFLFALTVPDQAWGAFAENLLKWCLQYLGVGAKTNAGYGFFRTDEPKQPTEPAKQSTAAQTILPPSTGREVWQSVTVSYNPGQRVLQVQRQHQGQTQGASADAQRTQQLLNSLSASAREKLTTGKRRLLADVEIEVSGNRRTIVKIIPKE
ncbi:MAG: type III-B CRISPR module RAMP protein Cmr6 [Chthonomonadetes bacterium]|nr:type III-B CRISPR module RAMP protein Cmr6 [Chthonomonadetes bacterium]